METKKQLDKTGCGIACVAMITNKSYKTIKSKMLHLNCIRANQLRTDFSDIQKILKFYKKNTSQKINVNSWKNLKENAIASINYNKKTNNWHWVVFDKKKNIVLDPQSKRIKRKITDKRMRLNSCVYVYE